MEDATGDAGFEQRCSAILDAINTVVDGKEEVARIALTVLLAQGHLLVEDVPGVGKTVLAKSLARTIDCSVNRIQFTPDLLPTDVTGVSIFNQALRNFEFRPGPVFANIVIADEINRASAKTQSALLECMEEFQVTVDGVTHTLAEPFMVVATQNPLEMEGTYPLPEAQRDRFMARVSLGYPHAEAETRMLTTHQSTSPLPGISPVTTGAAVQEMIEAVHSVYVSDAVKRYIVALGAATREHQMVRLGASPRALLQLLRAAKAHAALTGREFVVPDDVTQVAGWVLPHRLLLDRRAAAEGLDENSLLAQLIDRVPIPTGAVPTGAAGHRRRD